MIYKCIAMTSAVAELDEIVCDFEFEGTDGSSLMIVNVVNKYILGSLYEISVTQVENPLIPSEIQ